jgi:hypothetical protein
MATMAVITISVLGTLAKDPPIRNEPANIGCNSAQRRTASQLRGAACRRNPGEISRQYTHGLPRPLRNFGTRAAVALLWRGQQRVSLQFSVIGVIRGLKFSVVQSTV